MSSKRLVAASAVVLFGCGGTGAAVETAMISASAAGNGQVLAVAGAAGASATASTAAVNPGLHAIGGSAAPAAVSSSAGAPAVAGAAAPRVAPAAASVEVSAAPVPAGPSGIVKDPATGDLIFRTDPISLAAGKESYTCFAATVSEDVAVDGFSKGMQGFVHHIQFARTFAPEPEGLSECDVLFKLTWMPIFLAGAGPSELRLDEGVGHTLPQGTQLIVQLHLLNTTDKDIRQPVEIKMHRAASPNPTPVSPWAIGSSEINLPPKQAGQAQNVCTMTGDVDLVAVFPHMHMLGKQLKVEVGKSLDAMSTLYLRDPYDFDDQHMEKVKISLKTGDVLRVTCNYMNTGDKTAGFGESTHDEMCFFVGFAVGEFPGAADCPKLWDPLFQL